MSTEVTFNLEEDEVAVFIESMEEALQLMESGLLAWEQAGIPTDIEDIFRAAHSVKGMAGMVGHERMVGVAHVMEEVLVVAQKEQDSVAVGMIDDLLQTVDQLRLLTNEVVTGVTDGGDGDEMVAPLAKWLQEEGAMAVDYASAARPSSEELAGLSAQLVSTQPVWWVTVWAETTSRAPAARLYQVARQLGQIGEVVWQRPLLEEIAPGQQQLSSLVTGPATAAVIQAALARVMELALVEVVLWETSASEMGTAVVAADDGREIGLVEAGEVAEKGVEKTVRISIDRLDRLMNLVGELVTNRTRLVQIEEELVKQYQQDDMVRQLGDMVTQFSHVVSLVQDEVMRARMLPLERLFQTMPRLVRDLGRQLGKEVLLSIEGGATELDRSLLALIHDPFIHLVRNAVGHGLETPSEREAAGKARRGQVWLRATTAEGKVVITVADDGRGIDARAVGEQALATGVVSKAALATMSDMAIMDLIFASKVSTAEEITAVSGRGVGLAVVRTNVAQLGGTVMVLSEVGVGTEFVLTLPLTLAIVQTMLIEVQGGLYALPMAGIIESMYMHEVRPQRVKGALALNWRDTVLPLFDLRSFFGGVDEANGEIDNSRAAIITVQWGREQAGLIVDRIEGQQEIVVKTFSPIIGRVPGLSGATILGDGHIALIIDIPDLLNLFLRTK